jgi:glycosyltransferase involved in cell wall biosynthesis
LHQAWFRYVSYPRTLASRPHPVCHVLDQADAHLVRSLGPARSVVTCHDLIPLLASRGLIPMEIPATVATTFRWRIAQLADARRVIAPSHATRETLERFTRVNPSRIRVVPQGVGPPFGPIPKARERRRCLSELSESHPVVLQVSTAVRYKNTPVLLRAIARLRHQIGNIMLVRVGSALFPDEQALAVSLGIADTIRFQQAPDDDAMAEWYNAADAVVFPSMWEGFGWPVLEAMACGTPVVASDIPAHVELTGGSAELVPPADDAALAESLYRVLSDRDLANSLRERGRRRASEYTWARVAQATTAVYDEVAGH